MNLSHMLHVWNICQHLPEQNQPHVGKYNIHGAYGYSMRFTQGRHFAAFYGDESPGAGCGVAQKHFNAVDQLSYGGKNQPF